jgi:hypothetical protein
VWRFGAVEKGNFQEGSAAEVAAGANDGEPQHDGRHDEKECVGHVAAGERAS